MTTLAMKPEDVDVCPRCGRTREDIRDGEGCGDYEHCPGVVCARIYGRGGQAGMWPRP